MKYHYILHLKTYNDESQSSHIDTGIYILTSSKMILKPDITTCIKTADENCMHGDKNYPYSYDKTGYNLDTLAIALEYELSIAKDDKNITIKEFFNNDKCTCEMPFIIDDAYDINF